jgi:hypothetical protein
MNAISHAGFGGRHPDTARLRFIGREIEAKLAKADTYRDKAADMVMSVTQLLAEAKTLCRTVARFQKFRTHLCPSLGRSRTYELFVIASGKKSVEQSRAETKARVAKHRAKRVTDKSSVTANVVPLRPRIGGPALAAARAAVSVAATKDTGDDQADARRRKDDDDADAAAVAIIDAVAANNPLLVAEIYERHQFIASKILKNIRQRLGSVAMGGGA